MFRDPTTFADDLDALEDMERASLRLVAQALAVFGKEAREIFAGEKDHEGDIGEDITREALDSLGTILGSISPDDLLGLIFSTFCIGK